MVLNTEVGIGLLSDLRKPLKSYLELVDAEAGIAASPRIGQLLTTLTEARAAYASCCDDTLNDIFILEKYVQLFAEYGRLWNQIATLNCTESWTSLQNAFDLIRLIQRFSRMNVSAIEDQLYALEAAYPYNIFLASC